MALLAQTLETEKVKGWPEYICELSYEDRFLRRRKLVSECGTAFVVDLPRTTDLKHGDRLLLSNGKTVEIRARSEALVAITGDNLLALAWHIGNRHTPCQIESDRLLIRRDRVIEQMIQRLGGATHNVTEPFTAEGGAYGLGRTHSHSHGHSHHSHHIDQLPDSHEHN